MILGGTACSPCCICEVGILNHERRAKDLRESKQNQLTLHSKWIIARSMNRSSDRDSRGEAAARCKWNRGGSLLDLHTSERQVDDEATGSGEDYVKGETEWVE